MKQAHQTSALPCIPRRAPAPLGGAQVLRSSVSAKFAKDAPRLAIGPVRVTPEFVDDPSAGVDDPAREAQETAEGKKGFFQRYWRALAFVCFALCRRACAAERVLARSLAADGGKRRLRPARAPR